jgi:hypothetical protein
VRQRALEGRFRGSLLQMEEALSEVIAWGDDGLIWLTDTTAKPVATERVSAD